MRYKLFFRSLSILLLLSCPRLVSYSCGPEIFPDDDRFSLFRNSLLDNSSLVPFYFTHYYLNDRQVDKTADQIMNVEEWGRYTKNKALLADIYFTQYKVSPDDFLYAYNSNDWSQFSGNSFTNWLRRHQAALDYFAFAKKLEFQQFGEKDPWNNNNQPNQEKIAVPVDLAMQYVQQAPDKFLRLRYAFQAVKLAYYEAYYNAGNQVVNATQARLIYEKELKGKNTIVANWALVYYAMSNTNVVERTKNLLLAFDKTGDKKQFVYNWMDDEMLSSLEQHTTDKHLLALACTMKGLKTPGRALHQIKTLYSLEPNSIYLPLLLSREVNKIEDWIWSPDILDFEYGSINGEASIDDDDKDYFIINRKKDIAYLQQIIGFLNNLSESGQQNHDFVRLALIHCYHMLGDYSHAKVLLDQMPGDLAINYQQQTMIEGIINLAHQEDISSAAVQEKLYQQLVQLSKTGVDQKEGHRYDWVEYADEEEDDYAEMLMMLSKVFQSKHQMVIAGLLYQKANLFTNHYDGYQADSTEGYHIISWFDREASIADIDHLLAFKHQMQFSNFEQFISPKPWSSDEIYLDLKGTKQVREKMYAEALETFEQMSDSFWLANYEYKDYLPKTSITSVGTLLPVANQQIIQYDLPSKKLIMRDLNNVLSRYATCNNTDSLAELSFLLGNCYYNISYWGKAWMMFSYGNSANEHEDFDPGDYSWAIWVFKPNGNKYAEAYYDLQEARKMYRQVLASASNNRELKAKAAMMLYECDISNEAQDPDATSILKQYSDTHVYELALTHCPLFADLME